MTKKQYKRRNATPKGKTKSRPRRVKGFLPYWKAMDVITGGTEESMARIKEYAKKAGVPDKYLTPLRRKAVGAIGHLAKAYYWQCMGYRVKDSEFRKGFMVPGYAGFFYHRGQVEFNPRTKPEVLDESIAIEAEYLPKDMRKRVPTAEERAEARQDIEERIARSEVSSAATQSGGTNVDAMAVLAQAIANQTTLLQELVNKK